MDTEYGEFPLKSHLGMTIEGASDGAIAQIDIGEPHLNPNGVAHGAVLFAMVDTAMGKATIDVLPEGSFCASVEVQLRFLRPVLPGHCVAKATVIKPGRSIVHLGAEVHDHADRLVATATGTFAVINPPD